MPGKDNSAPALNGIGSKRIANGSLLQFALNAYDADRYDTLSFSASGLPTGAQFNQTTKTFSWTPTEDAIGIHTVTFSVSDGDQSDAEQIKIFVLETGSQGSPPSRPSNVRLRMN
jgi:hypothetical protein